MLLIPTFISSSSVHGIGVFAADAVEAGTPVWKFHEGLDTRIAPALVEALTGPALRQCLNYTYRCMDTGEYILCADDARFFNHADEPNTHTVQRPDGTYHDIARVRIEPGEELTCDYRTFDADWRKKLGRE